jgi:hypothetical protein
MPDPAPEESDKKQISSFSFPGIGIRRHPSGSVFPGRVSGGLIPDSVTV